MLSVSLSSSALPWTFSRSICKHLSSLLVGFFLVHPRLPPIFLPSLPCLDFLSLTTLSCNYPSLSLLRSLSRFVFLSMLGLDYYLQVIYFSKTRQVASSCVGVEKVIAFTQLLPEAHRINEITWKHNILATETILWQGSSLSDWGHLVLYKAYLHHLPRKMLSQS